MKKIGLTLIVVFTVINSIYCQTPAEQTVKKKFTEYIEPKLDGRILKIKNTFTGDLNGDGLPDVVVDYCIETTSEDTDAGGGNAMMNYACKLTGVAVYLKIGSDFVLKADKEIGDIKRDFVQDEVSFEIKGIENGKIVYESTSYGTNDPRCCPSVKTKIQIKYQAGKLIKQ